jgi:beta-lactam-binding protein with PASTA domain
MARRPVPADLEDALAASPAARDRFWSLPPEQLDAWVTYVERARFPGQRRRRIGETVRRLGGAPVRTETTQTEPAAVVALPRDDTWTWLVGAALLLGLAAFLVWLTVYRNNDDKSSTSAVVVTAKSSVPKVTGIKLEAAQFQLKEAKLGVKVVRRTGKKPKNIVLGQAPKAEKQVVQGTVVTLVVSKGRAGAKVPKLTGLAAADAVKQLQGLGLTASLAQQSAAGAAPGTVVAQSPKPGKQVKRGSVVQLGVARGAAAIAVPDVTGHSQQDAEHDLQQRGLNVTVAMVPSTKPAGTVVAQSPAPDSKVQQGSTVRLNVAKAAARPATTTTETTTQTTTQTTTTRPTTTRPTTTRATTTTPVQQGSGNDYRGMRLQAAVQKIAQGRQQVVVQYVTSTQAAGVVVANSTAGNKVRLQVSAGARPQAATAVPDETGQDSKAAESDLTSAGFSVLTVDWPVSDAASEGTVVYETPAGQAPRGSTVVIYVGSTS